MNQKRKHLSDATLEFESPEVAESPEVTARLDEIERRLKATRPQSAQLNLVALQQVADRAATVELPTARKSRSALVIAGSWVCGVAVGALVMFVMMSLAASSEMAGDHVDRNERETPGPLAQDSADDASTEPDSDLPHDSPTVVNAASRKTGATVLTATFDPLGSSATYSADAPPLQVGTHLRRAARNSVWPFGLSAQAERASADKYDFAPSETRKRTSFDRKPKLPTSRRDMMQEFLRGSFEAVL